MEWIFQEDEPKPEQKEPEPEQQEPEPEQHEPEPEQQEPELEQQEPELEQQSELETERAKTIQLMRETQMFALAYSVCKNETRSFFARHDHQPNR